MVVNRAVHELSLEPERSLLSVLREELGLTGAKPGCGEGVCGACTVLVDGEPVRSCITLAIDVAGRAVTTVEGLARDGMLHPVQRAFVEEGAMQCGYCTPGMILGVASLLEKSPDPDEALIRESLAGNVCRCCTYPRIVRALRRAAALASRRRGVGGGAAAPPTPGAAGSRPRTVGPARSRGTRLLRRALRRDGRRPLPTSRARMAGGRPATARGSTSARTGSSRRSPARSTSGRTTARPCPSWSPRSCVCRSSASGW